MYGRSDVNIVNIDVQRSKSLAAFDYFHTQISRFEIDIHVSENILDQKLGLLNRKYEGASHPGKKV